MIDTNIVLDVLLQREPFFQASYEVMKRSAQDEIEGFVSVSAATDIFYWICRRSRRRCLCRHRFQYG